jgi:uncharacterized protein YjbJ (UPF0337 family)
MDDRIKGDTNVVKGKVEQGVGQVTGDTETEAQGQADEARGRGQQVVGDVRQGVHNAGERIDEALHGGHDRAERAANDVNNDLNR